MASLDLNVESNEAEMRVCDQKLYFHEAMGVNISPGQY